MVLSCVPGLLLAQVKQDLKFTAPPVSQPDTSRVMLLAPVSAVVKNNTANYFTLRQCIDYAMLHQPALNRSLIGVNIARATNAVNLSGWLPQVTVSGSGLHYLQQSNGVYTTTGGTTGTTTGGTTGTTTGGTTTGGTTGTTTGGTTGTTTGGTTGTTTGGTTNGNTTTSAGGTSVSVRDSYSLVPQLYVSQALFSPSLLYAYKSASLYITQAQQVTDSTKIFLVSAVSKAFYNLLLNLEQINVLREDTARLAINVRDTYHQYVGGIVDETDYEEATITLNNAKAQLKMANENVVPLYATLKQYMGFPPEQQFNVNFDTVEMMRSVHVDTLQQLQYEKRIEYRQLNTEKSLQGQLVNYYRFSFLPTVSAFYNYNLAYQNNRFSDLLSTSYPTQLVGVSVNIPVFTGFARVNNIRKARLQQQLLNWDEVDLKSEINREYTTALADYKSSYYNVQLLQKNVAMARRVYFVVTLQYKQGIVAYLNVITAESNIITAETSYLNALFQLLSSKIDLQKAMGNITY